MGFPRQEYWRGLPFSSPGDLPDLGRSNPCLLHCQVDSLPLSYLGSPIQFKHCVQLLIQCKSYIKSCPESPAKPTNNSWEVKTEGLLGTESAYNAGDTGDAGSSLGGRVFSSSTPTSTHEAPGAPSQLACPRAVAWS